MSNIFGDGMDDLTSGITAGADADATSTGSGEEVDATDADTTATTDTETTFDVTADGGVDLTSLVDLMSEAGVDSVWLDLDGDLIPETMVATDGPFDVESDYDVAYDDWSTVDAYDFDVSSGELDGEAMSILLPMELDAGYPDPFVLSDVDWCDCGVYDPMTAAPDWTVEGYADFTELYSVPGMDAGFSDAGGYYDATMPTAGYFDVDSYYDTSGGYLDASMPIDTWDLPAAAPGMGFDAGMGFDGGTGFDTGAGFDTGMGYDATGYDATSGWDPTAGDASHEAFLDTITGDYSDPGASWDLDTASDTSQFWMDEYDAASDLSWDAWNASMDAYVAGDDMAAYDFNQTSLAAESYANDAWSYSNDAWSSTSSFDTTSSYSADDGWYDAMSLD